MKVSKNMRLLATTREFIRDRFNLDEDKADELQTIENLRKGIEFRGTNLWVLIFAIIVASVGLNVNSTAVIIGAMLISPLMGPIMGIGLGVGINDFELIKRAFKNLAILLFQNIIPTAIQIAKNVSSLYGLALYQFLYLKKIFHTMILVKRLNI